MPHQLRLDLRKPPAFSRDGFVVSDSNRDAVGLLDQPELWNAGVLALVGPAGSGKTHLARAWAAERGALTFEPGKPLRTQLDRAQGRDVLWDDADVLRGRDEALFHLINIAGRGGRLLLTGKEPPRVWPAKLPDLRSRLKGLTVATLEEPDEAVLAGVLATLFRARNIRPADDVLPYLLRRMERSVPAAAALVERLDEEGKPVTRVLARAVLGDVEAQD